MDVKIATGKAGAGITTVFGIDRSDTSTLFDDIQLTRPVRGQTADVDEDDRYFEYMTAALEAENEHSSTQIVIHLPHATDGIEEKVITAAANTNPHNGNRHKGQLPPPSRNANRSSAQDAPPTHAMAMCEVFNFTNGVIDQLRSQVASLPIAGRYHMGKPRHTMRKKHNSSKRVAKIDLHIPEREFPASASSSEQTRAARRTLGKRLSTISRIRQTYASCVEEFQADPNIEKTLKVKNIEVPQIFAEKKEEESESQPHRLIDLVDEYAATTEDMRGRQECSELVLPSLDLHRNSNSSIGSTRQPSEHGNSNYEFPPTDPLPILPKIERKGEEAINIYRIAKNRARTRTQNSETEGSAEETCLHMSFLAGAKVRQVMHKDKQTPNILSNRNAVRTRQQSRTFNGNRSKEISMSKTSNEDEKLKSGRGSKQRKMFLESDYNQFCHRKVKRLGALSRENSKNELQYNSNLISKPYDQHQAMQYIKLKIGDLVSASPIAELTPRSMERVSVYTEEDDLDIDDTESAVDLG